MSDSASVIDLPTYNGVTGAFFAIAIICAVSRGIIRWHKLHRVFWDDALFLAAVITLIASTTLNFIQAPYAMEDAELEAGDSFPTATQLLDVEKSLQYLNPTATLLIATIVFVKFSFLIFFRALAWPLPRLMRWWWCVLAILVPCCIFLLLTETISCRYQGAQVIFKCTSSTAQTRDQVIVYLTAAIDILTDLLTISIPIFLLWNVKITLRRKLILGAIFSLSVFMIAIAIIRVSKQRLANGTTDPVWAFFWLGIEASVAVIVNSGTAFRSLFVKQDSRYNKSPRNVKPEQASPSPRHWKNWGKSGSQASSQQLRMPEIPSATFTGVRSFIHRAGRDDSTLSTLVERDSPLLGPTDGPNGRSMGKYSLDRQDDIV
ncbi:hypothetical protein MMC25_004315 [Agyrium rufum]|nr:hypothetical protein [Agyrium rufum]